MFGFRAEFACHTRSMSTPTGASVVSIDPDVLSGTPVFRGTRVPVAALFDHLTAGAPLEEFLEGFPTVTRETALPAIAEAGEALVGPRGACNAGHRRHRPPARRRCAVRVRR